MAFNFGLKAFKSTFFNPNEVTKEMKSFEKKALSKLGAFIRQRAKSSIRKTKKSSKPGEPPRSHIGTLRRLMFFGYDPNTRSVVAGPVKFQSKHMGNATVPDILEHGGPSLVRERRPRIRQASPAQAAAYRQLIADGRIKPPPKYTLRPINILPRPFMKPAGDEEARRFPQTLRSMKK